jgi:hypothetical protein
MMRIINNKLKRIGLCTAVLLFVFFGTALAQDVLLEDPSFAIMALYGFGIEMPLMDDLNAAFTQNGYDKIDFYSLFSHGIHFYTRFDKFITGVDSFSIANSALFENEANNNKLKLKMKYAYFNLGFAPFSSKSFTIFSLLGIGANKSTMYIYETTTDSFLTFLGDPSGSSIFSSLSFSLKGTLGFLVTFAAKNQTKFSVGLVGHYHFIPGQIRWKIFNDIEITDVPESLRHAFNAGIVVGYSSP